MEKLKNGLIVSCQALEGEPLHSSYIMSRMAVAAKEGGAVGIRANSVADILAIKNEVGLPIIGIIKQDYDGFDVYITPTYEEVEALAKVGVEIIAMDGTFHTRPKGESLEQIVKKIKGNFPHIKLMADIATVEEAMWCEKIGFDFVGTTLHGYTKESLGCDVSNQNFKFLREVIAAVSIPVIAEGKVDTPEKAKKVLELGAYCVVVGGAITRPQEITKRFMREIEGVRC